MKDGACPKDIELNYPDYCDDAFWEMLTDQQEKKVDSWLRVFVENELTIDQCLDAISRGLEKEDDKRVISIVFNIIAIDFERQVREHYPARIRNSHEYQEWRACVFERDHYTCQNCGQVGGSLNAHHIKSFKDYPKLRLEVSNGITLCRECHLLAHGKKARECR